MTARIPDFLVEKVHLGEATPAERALVEADPDARRRLEALPAQDAAFHAAMPVADEWPRIEARARIAAARDATRSNRAVMGSVVFAPLLAAMLALLWVGRMQPPVPVGGIEPTTTKGSSAEQPRLRIYRKRNAGPERVTTGVVAREGDVLQIGVASKKPEHGVVVSVDGRGEVTLHWPPEPGGTTDLAVGETLTPAGYTLDDAPEFERFFLVTSGEQPADVDAVVDAAETLAASGEARTGVLPVPKRYAQSSFVVRKEDR
jgi:hypothetical protein